MNKRDFFELILPKVTDILSQQDLKFKRSKDAFQGKINGGWMQVQFDFYEFALSYNTNLAFKVRIDAVEEICSRFIYINPQEVKNTATLILTLPGLLNYGSGVFSFPNIAGLHEIIDEYYIPFLTQRLPDLSNKYTQLDFLYELLTNSDEKNYNQVKNGYRKVITILTISKLLKRDDFEESVQKYRKLFVKNGTDFPSDFDIELYNTFFEKFLDYLRTIN